MKRKRINNAHKDFDSKSYVLDTSVIIERVASRQIKKGKLRGNIIIPNAVLAELEHQANTNQETGFIGFDELAELYNLAKEKKIKLEFQGLRPAAGQIRHARLGEIDSIVKELAARNKATLVTADYVQAKSAEVFGMAVMLIKIRKLRKALSIEKYFEKDVMSVHLKEESFPYGKKGMPGNWHLAKLGNKKLTKEFLQKMAKEIVEKARITENAFVEISRPSLTIVQYGQYRIVIVKSPLADGLEITAVKPLRKFMLEHYNLKDTMLQRLEKARGLIVSGEPGSGKSTFVQALAEFYAEKGFIVKTVESPRDLQLPTKITQYSKNFASSADIHDILFLSRPDYIIFDEMRDTPDFTLYTDLRLAGSECIGVLHSASPIDAIQRFIGRLEVGMIPSIVDTIIFIDAGKVHSVLTLSLKVKVPSGMHEADLVRPVIEVRDFTTEKLYYELYKYGEETVVVPIATSGGGREGRGDRGAKARGETETSGSEVSRAEIKETKRDIIIPAEPGRFTLLIDGKPVSPINIGDIGQAVIKKKSRLGRYLLKALHRRKRIELQ